MLASFLRWDVTSYRDNCYNCTKYKPCCIPYTIAVVYGSAKYKLATLDCIEICAKLIDVSGLVEAKRIPWTPVTCLPVFYWIHRGECTAKLHDIIPPSPFRHWGTICRLGFHPHDVDIPRFQTKRYASSIIRQLIIILCLLICSLSTLTWAFSWQDIT